MGNIPGLPDFPAEAISEKSNEVMKYFATTYATSYPGTLIAVMKEEKAAAASPGPEYRLSYPPTPTEPLRTGMFSKRGAVQKSWKKRHFVAANKSDNFEVSYYVSASDAGDVKKRKGVMILDGYKVQHVEEEKEQESLGCGKFGLKMECGRRRMWVVSFEDEEEMKEWKAVFENASRHAKPPMNKDEVLRRCFKISYQRLRWHFGYWGWWSLAGTEQEQLGQLIVDECNRSCMSSVYDEVRKMSPTLRRKAEEKVQELLDKTVGAVVSAGWSGALQSIEQMSGTIRGKAEESLGSVIEQQLAVRNKIKDAIVDTMMPVLEKIANPVLDPVLAHMLDPIYEAFSINMNLFNEFVTDLSGKDAESFDKELHDRLRRGDYYWGFMHKSYEALHTLTRTDRMQILSELCSGIYRWTIEDRIEDDLKTLQKKALFTLMEGLNASETKDAAALTAAARSTAEALAHDSKIVAKNACTQILMDGLSPPFKREVGSAVADLVSPISDAVPAPLKDMVDVDGTLDGLLMDTLEECCAGVVNPSCESRNSQFDSIAAGTA